MSHKEPKVDKSGWLYKQGEARKSWKKRFMKLCGDKLYYYSSPKVRGAPLSGDTPYLLFFNGILMASAPAGTV